MVKAQPVRALGAELLAQAARWPNQGFTSRIFVLHDQRVKDKIKILNLRIIHSQF